MARGGERRHAVGGPRVRIRVPEWKFSSFHADSLQCAPPRCCTNHVECTFFNLSCCLLFPLFLFLFQTSPRHLEEMRGPRAHHRLHLCTHRAYIRNVLSHPSPSRIDADVFFSSLPLAVVLPARAGPLFFRHCTSELRFLRDRINHATSVHCSPLPSPRIWRTVVTINDKHS